MIGNEKNFFPLSSSSFVDGREIHVIGSIHHISNAMKHIAFFQANISSIKTFHNKQSFLPAAAL